jgi:hypothetical protein
MNSAKKIIIIIIVILLLIAIAFVAFCKDSKANTFISNTIYFLTFVVITWYSYETKLLREATSGRPLISIIKNVSDTIEVRNDGSNIAYNIKIYFYYNNREALNKHLGVAILGKGLSHKIGISNMEIDKGDNRKVKLSDLINASPPDENLKVLIVYSDSPEDKNQFKDKWRPDETVIMNTANEGRFRMIWDRKIT